MTRPRLLLRVLKGCSALLMLAVLGVAALFGLVWLEHRSSVTLPVPTGSFVVRWTRWRRLPERGASCWCGCGIRRSVDRQPSSMSIFRFVYARGPGKAVGTFGRC